MRTNKKNTKKQVYKKAIIIPVVVIVVLLLSGVAFAIFLPRNNTVSPSTNQGSDQGDNKDQVVTTTKDSPSDKPPAPVENSVGKSSVEVALTAHNQNSSTYQLRYSIAALVSDGNCTLTLTKQGADIQTITKTASPFPNASTSTCQGFDIALSELEKGTWQTKMVFENETLKGETSYNITVE